MVGHTHEDVDQRFSRLSQYLSKRSATTMEGMYTLCVWVWVGGWVTSVMWFANYSNEMDTKKKYYLGLYIIVINGE